MRNHLILSTLLALSLIAVAQQKPAANAPAFRPVGNPRHS